MRRTRLRVAVLWAVALIAACTAGPAPTPEDPEATKAEATSPAGPTDGAGGSASATPTPGSTGGAAATIPPSGTWALVQPTGEEPSAREDHTWTVSEDGRTAYLFGGRDSLAPTRELWAFDLVAERWRQIPISGTWPEARFGHDAAWVAGRGLVVFAGQAGSTFFDDLWLFDPATTTWRLLPAAGDAPVARYGSCSGIGPDGRLWISHGFTADGVRFADTRAYDFGAETWSSESPTGAGPVERCLHACWWTAGGELALYGGQTTGIPALGDLWRLTPGTGGAPSHRWAEVEGEKPAARQLPAVGRWGTVTVIFGGRGLDRAPLGDAWLLADESNRFVELQAAGGPPDPRSGATLIHDPQHDRMLLFGGLGDEHFADLWSLSFD